MTIKEFARLCGCNTQTLRYYDKIDLLKPVQVDPWSGYRYYDPQQAVDFVKIKNLQAADFSIQEIKRLLALSDQQVYAAFEGKIAEQAQKLERIREIQRTYLAEKTTMEQIIYTMTDYILSQCSHPEVLPEFGLPVEAAPDILDRLRNYLNELTTKNLPQEEVSMTVNDEVVQGRDAVLGRIQSLTKENLKDNIQLNTGYGHSVGHSTDPHPNLTGYEVIWECRGWAHVADVMGQLPLLDPEKVYYLRLETNQEAYSGDLSMGMFLLGTVLNRQPQESLAVSCSVSAEEGKENCFQLLCKK